MVRGGSPIEGHASNNNDTVKSKGKKISEGGGGKGSACGQRNISKMYCDSSVPFFFFFAFLQTHIVRFYNRRSLIRNHEHCNCDLKGKSNLRFNVFLKVLFGTFYIKSAAMCFYQGQFLRGSFVLFHVDIFYLGKESARKENLQQPRAVNSFQSILPFCIPSSLCWLPPPEDNYFATSVMPN